MPRNPSAGAEDKAGRPLVKATRLREWKGWDDPNWRPDRLVKTGGNPRRWRVHKKGGPKPRERQRFPYRLPVTPGRSRTEWSRDYGELVLSRIDGDLQAEIRRYTQFQRGRGTRVTSIANTVVHLRLLALGTGATRTSDITPERASAAIEAYARGRSPRSVVSFLKVVRAFLNWYYEGEIPKPLRSALERKRSPPAPERRPLSVEEFQALLAAAHGPCVWHPERDTALLWILWDSGMRVSEVVSLRRGDVVYHADGGVSLCMPKNAPLLKTGPRDVYVIESVPYIEAWMRVAKNKNSDAPLFPQENNTDRPLFATYVAKILSILSDEAGIRHVHPHLFRHTRATRAAAAGWNEFEMNAHFGWVGDGKMAARYVHLRDLHLQDRVKADHAVEPVGNAIEALGDLDHLEAELEALVATWEVSQ